MRSCQPARVQAQWQFSAAQILYQGTIASFQEQKDQVGLVGPDIC
jgi:hypothetical protein